MSEMLTTQYPQGTPPVESAIPDVAAQQAAVVEWAANKAGSSDAEAARILAQNTVRLLGWAATGDQAPAHISMPHPSAEARSAKVAAAQPELYEAPAVQPHEYFAAPAATLEEQQANSLRAADNLVNQAEMLRARYSQQREADARASKGRQTRARQGQAPHAAAAYASNISDEQVPSFSSSEALGSASGRMAIVGDIEQRAEEQRHWESLPFEQQYPGSRDPALAKAYLVAAEEFDQAKGDPGSAAARAASDRLFELDMQMRESPKGDPTAGVTVEGINKRLVETRAANADGYAEGSPQAAPVEAIADAASPARAGAGTATPAGAPSSPAAEAAVTPAQAAVAPPVAAAARAAE